MARIGQRIREDGQRRTHEEKSGERLGGVMLLA